MRTYNVKLAEGVFVRVNADNPEDAAAKAKAEIAKREGEYFNSTPSAYLSDN